MERVQSLAEYLGLAPSGVAGEVPRLEDIADAKQFAEAVLASVEFRRYIVDALTLGTLQPVILCRIMDHGWGKPVQRLEFDDRSVRLEDLTPDVVAEKLERVQRMLSLIQSSRTGDKGRSQSVDEGDELVLASVH